MKFYSSIFATSRFSSSKGTAICIGNFDGVHLGHQELFRTLNENPASENLDKGVLSFAPHPKKVISDIPLSEQRTDEKYFYLTSLRKKIDVISNFSFDFFYLIHFNQSFASLLPGEFIIQYLIKKLNAKLVVVGHDWRFAKGASGDLNFLERELSKHGAQLIVVEPYKKDETIVSSSLLKKKLAEGNLPGYLNFAGRKFEILGQVKHGEKIGRELGFPTANITLSSQLLPPRGVYLTKTTFENRVYNSLTNIGIRPTFLGSDVSVETFMLDQSALDMYGKRINLSFEKFLRPEKKFKSSEALRQQIEKDVEHARQFFDE